MAKKSEVPTELQIDEEFLAQREKEVAEETDEQIIERLSERFDMLTDFTLAIKKGKMHAMIVAGPPGVGKSFGVEAVLQKDSLFDLLAERDPKYEVVKGAMSALGLYAKLWEFSEKGNVVVFDDCDAVLLDQDSLNVLKGALDTSERRYISWNKDSRLLRADGIPDRFEFCGSAIFITNIKFDYVRSKKLRDHLRALRSRCKYVNLDMDTDREKLLRINDIVRKGMLEKYQFEDGVVEEILAFIKKHSKDLEELSLRTVLNVADCRDAFPRKWEKYALAACGKGA